MTESGISPNSVELPCDVELPAQPATVRRATEAPAVAERGAPLYTIHSARPRWQIIRDYAVRNNLTVAQIDALVRQLPDYGLRSQLHASLAVVENVVVLADERARRGR